MINRFSIFLLVAFYSLSGYSADTAEYRHGIFRVNTDISSGLECLETVAEKAKDKNLEFIVFSDQFLVKAEYGIPPFRNLMKKTKELKSVSTYGLEGYLQRIEELNRKYPGMIAVPGVDVAPHYFWTGSYLKRNLVNHQFSEQLTVFGSTDPEFYRKLPVIHNDRWCFNLLKLFPLLLSLAGVLLLLGMKRSYYNDAQGNKYYPKSLARMFIGIALMFFGLLWTIDNRPFAKIAGCSQYSHLGSEPYQMVMDYVGKTSGVGIVWSAPEATTKVRFESVNLVTLPYLDDIENTSGHNGFAGIYADTSHAHEPGKTWDKMLIEFCEGKRMDIPAIVGESDYHGKLVQVDFIQTVIRVSDKDFNMSGIVNALKKGNSYAVSKPANREIVIEEATISNSANSAGFGETLDIGNDGSLILRIKCKVEGSVEKERIPGKLTVVSNGVKISESIVELNGLDHTEKIPIEKIPAISADKGYIRFYIKSDAGAGWLLGNPMFLRKR